MRLPQLASVTKAIVNVCTLIFVIGPQIVSVTTAWPSPKVALLVSGVIGVAGAVAHYYAPNVTTDPQVAATQSVRLKAPPPS